MERIELVFMSKDGLFLNVFYNADSESVSLRRSEIISVYCGKGTANRSYIQMSYGETIYTSDEAASQLQEVLLS